jgi:hypothetical protein
MTPDQFNGLFEACGALMIWVSIRRTLRDRVVRGVSAWSVTFFTVWGYWNTYFYIHLDQPWSLAGAVVMVLSNSTWVALLIRFRWHEHRRHTIMMDEQTLAQFDT